MVHVVQGALVLSAVAGVTPETRRKKTPVYAYSDGLGGTQLTLATSVGAVRVGEVSQGVSDGIAEVLLDWSAPLTAPEEQEGEMRAPLDELPDVTIANVEGAGFGEATYRGDHPDLHALLSEIERDTRGPMTEVHHSCLIDGDGGIYRFDRPWKVHLEPSGKALILVSRSPRPIPPADPLHRLMIPFHPARLVAVRDRLEFAKQAGTKRDREAAARAALRDLGPGGEG